MPRSDNTNGRTNETGGQHGRRWPTDKFDRMCRLVSSYPLAAEARTLEKDEQATGKSEYIASYTSPDLNNKYYLVRFRGRVSIMRIYTRANRYR